MADLVLVKHAAPDILPDRPGREWHLSDAGRAQCEPLAERLRPYAPRSLHCSEEPKAFETAQGVGRHLGLDAIPAAGLHENDRTGLPFFGDRSELDATLRRFFERPSERIIGVETADAAHARFAEAIRAVTSRARHPTVVVAHGTVITLLIARANGIDPFRFWAAFDLTSFAVCSDDLTLLEVVHPRSRGG